MQAVAAGVIVLSFMLTFHGLRHLRAFQEDRVVGREILPVAIGSRATRVLAATLLLIGVGALGILTL
jgi:hypothetical protein